MGTSKALTNVSGPAMLPPLQQPGREALSMQLQHAGDGGSPMAVHDHAEPPNLAEHGRCQDYA
jgi:hypothetical protein